MIIGRNLVEDQRLYSTGDCELDELLEKAFCEGYEYAQKEFGGNAVNKAAKRAFEANLGGFGIAGGLGKARTRMNNNPEKFKNIKDAAVNIGRQRQRPTTPSIYEKLGTIDQKINARGFYNTGYNGRPNGDWRATSQNILHFNNK